MKYLLQTLWLFFALAGVSTLTGCYTKIVPLSSSSTQALQVHLQELDKGTLIVRLYTNNPKRRTLQSLGNTAAVRAHDDDRAQYSKEMMEVWGELYGFSDVRFIPDSLFAAFRAEEDIALFLNDKLELDPTIVVEKNPYYVLARGSRDYAFVWLDDQLEPLIPQPPLNYDKLSLWEMLQGREKVLRERVTATDLYFNSMVGR